MDADQEPSEPLFAWYQRTEPEGDTTWKAALEGSAVNPDADAESAPDPVPRSSFTSGRETSALAEAQRSVLDPYVAQTCTA